MNKRVVTNKKDLRPSTKERVFRNRILLHFSINYFRVVPVRLMVSVQFKKSITEVINVTVQSTDCIRRKRLLHSPTVVISIHLFRHQNETVNYEQWTGAMMTMMTGVNRRLRRQPTK